MGESAGAILGHITPRERGAMRRSKSRPVEYVKHRGLSGRKASAISPFTGVGNDIAIGGAHTLYATYAKYNNTVTCKPGGDQLEPLDDATTVTCPEGGGWCLIEFDQYLQIGNSATGNRWSICAELDGVPVSTPVCLLWGFTHS